jgi:hypothetical protein
MIAGRMVIVCEYRVFINTCIRVIISVRFSAVRSRDVKIGYA